MAYTRVDIVAIMGHPRRPHNPVTAVLMVVMALLVGCGGSEGGTLDGPVFFRGPGLEETEVIIPKRPVRILATSATSFDFLTALGAGDRLVGIPEQVFDYTEPPGGADRWRDLPTFGHYRAEEVLALEPDFVVAHSYQARDTTSLLKRAGIPVVLIPDLTKIEEIRSALRLLDGATNGDTTRADALIADLDRRIAALARPTRRTALCYTDFGAGGWSAGSNSSFHLLVELAGMTNAGAEGDRVGHYQIDNERVLALSPDVFVVPTAVDGSSPSAGRLRSEPSISALPAIRENRIVILDTRLFSTSSHRVVEAAEKLAAEVDRMFKK